MPYARILAMIISFATVVYMMNYFEGDGFAGSSFGAMFTKQNFNPQPEVEGAQNWTWCNKRVESFTWKDLSDPANNYKIHQEGIKWMLDRGEKINMAQVKMELWLAKYCTTPVEATKAQSLSRKDFELRMEYQNGNIIDLTFSKAGSLMQWGDHVYKAPHFLEALLKLPYPDEGVDPGI